MQKSKSENKVVSIGDTFEKYTIEKLLGKGGMGAVYLARHNVLDSLFAIKILSSEIATRNKQFVNRFIREAKLACKIKHPNLIAVYDAGKSSEKNLYYIVMEYVDGGNVRDILKQQRLVEPFQALATVRQITLALIEAQKHNMVHRDIKPDNIMYTSDGVAKLADLGIAKSTNEQDTMLTVDASVFGTPAYMSPEQATDSRQVDSRSDIYSLGIVFFEMLTGSRPYRGESMIEILSQVIKDEEIVNIKKILPNLNDDITNLVSLMTTKNKNARIQSPLELLQKIDAIKFKECDSSPQKLKTCNIREKKHELSNITLPTMVQNSETEITMPTLETIDDLPTLKIQETVTKKIDRIEKHTFTLNEPKIKSNSKVKRKKILLIITGSISILIIVLSSLVVFLKAKPTAQFEQSKPYHQEKEKPIYQEVKDNSVDIVAPTITHQDLDEEPEKIEVEVKTIALALNGIIYVGEDDNLYKNLKSSILKLDDHLPISKYNFENYGTYKEQLSKIINEKPKLVILDLSQYYANLGISNSSFENLIRDIGIVLHNSQIPFAFLLHENINDSHRKKFFDNAIKELVKFKSYSTIDMNKFPNDDAIEFISDIL